MKKVLYLLFCLLLITVCGWRELDYSSPANWLICDKGAADGREFDLFYIYPTLYAGKKEIMPILHDAKVRAKALDWAVAQTGIFQGRCRVFAPVIRQTEYRRVLKDIRATVKGDFDAINALRYYLKHFNSSRPFVLLGHSQGAINLYNALKKLPEISPQRGFAAAYLPGLPAISAEQIKKDFAGRSIRPASGDADTGVIIIWNTQSPTAVKSVFAARGAYCINPLNWRTDETPADAKSNLRTQLYRFYLKDKSKRMVIKTRFCGAAIDLDKGALIADLPENSEFDAASALGRGVFHSVDIWLFAGNIAENAALRVRNLK